MIVDAFNDVDQAVTSHNLVDNEVENRIYLMPFANYFVPI